MTKAILPRTNQTGANEWSDVESNDAALAKVINGELDNENIAKAAGITREKLASDAKGIVGTWYTPKIINTEESRTNTAFGTMPTADEITGVVIPENGLVVIGYRAVAKSTVEAAGTFAAFLGSNQIKAGVVAGSPEVRQVNLTGTEFKPIGMTASGPAAGNGAYSGDVTTGQLLIPTLSSSPLAVVFAAPGTYSVSMQFKASSGAVTVKERKLWVAVLGG
ncbi:MAG TPA: hypothetical protein VFJ76_07740 [Solirubrobacterales bacterium]|nr:hypothetical protein [Solirubrobacterales bacterium]